MPYTSRLPVMLLSIYLLAAILQRSEYPFIVMHLK